MSAPIRRWTAAEETYLTRWWGKRPPSQIGAALGRTVIAVHTRADHLGLAVDAAGYSLALIAEGLDVHERTVRQWVARGWLRARRYSDAAGGPGQRWCVTEDALVAFLRAYPTVWRPESPHARRARRPQWLWIAGLIGPQEEDTHGA
jgi:hypothetical protein